MATNIKRRFKDTSGLLSLEASIALTIFIFLMLFMFSFLSMFEARNQVAHVLLTTADSLALDPLANESPSEDDIIEQILSGIHNAVTDSHGSFTEPSKWYDGDEATIADIAKTRFVAYLAGGSDEKAIAEANRILKELNIVNGLKGLDFSGSCVKDGKLFLSVSYKVEYEFQVFGMDTLEMKQTCCSKLWK